MKTIAVVGKNFGDEGKGLAVDYLSLHSSKALVVRHNGGAQSGHTVELKNRVTSHDMISAGGERFVFHELSSGSLRHADTLWIESFYPDLYKLSEEAENFKATFGYVPSVYAMENTCITIPDDILINMALESSRGKERHGSCGMGINECDIRTGAGYGLTLREIRDLDTEGLLRRLSEIRRSHTWKRIEELSGLINESASEYIELLHDENVLLNASETMIENFKYIKLLTEESLKVLLEDIETLIFETGQGLLLDCENEEYAPHVTASRTGIHNPCAFLRRMGLELDEVMYVTRSYVTRHGAGYLPCECDKEILGSIDKDLTNEPNEWQGHIRYAAHESEEGFISSIKKDISEYGHKAMNISLLVTHLNETENRVITNNRRIPINDFASIPAIRGLFSEIYLSSTRYAEDITRIL
ncbi:adenylosuccinate synthase [Lachnospiraceae bacterium JC7]|nr:adenylosuccinate synthase [Lachnospiraceae bacterium JC7]